MHFRAAVQIWPCFSIVLRATIYKYFFSYSKGVVEFNITHIIYAISLIFILITKHFNVLRSSIIRKFHLESKCIFWKTDIIARTSLKWRTSIFGKSKHCYILVLLFVICIREHKGHKRSHKVPTFGFTNECLYWQLDKVVHIIFFFQMLISISVIGFMSDAKWSSATLCRFVASFKPLTVN